MRKDAGGEELFEMEIGRLDAIFTRLWEQFERDAIGETHEIECECGKVHEVVLGKRDADLSLVNAIQKNRERYQRLYGMEKPVKVEGTIKVNHTHDHVVKLLELVRTNPGSREAFMRFLGSMPNQQAEIQ